MFDHLIPTIYSNVLILSLAQVENIIVFNVSCFFKELQGFWVILHQRADDPPAPSSQGLFS